ncbi:Podospora anserina S mat+ genomic DNA chromosome 1, supercontig 4 [Echinococcus multilocularis]|uniref:Podospora anserina S mat+ genomic DNA chromosome 1, supercontig 4 n=1 Tax=Echinococcus multilocularis TaxID=6211 RepID=A0A0S4MI24_ECHMU|nr:Podospora anserina S mat+ genomic DNA chromosome 1, supercontig 4 [Echinococcus multilocularis]
MKRFGYNLPDNVKDEDCWPPKSFRGVAQFELKQKHLVLTTPHAILHTKGSTFNRLKVINNIILFRKSAL